ncbi:MAG: tyrosine-type recombinase/integrase [Dyadobacter sp.]
MPLSETYPIQNFLDYLTYQKRYSSNTIISYQNDLSAFFDFVIMEYNFIPMQEISPAIARSWLATLKENKLASKTVNRKISALKSFFKYQLKSKNISSSPVSAIGSIKVSKRLPSFISQKDMAALFDSIGFSDGFQGSTERLVMGIFYNTGIRLSELLNLIEGQVDRSNGIIKVLGKRNKERIIPVSNDLLNDIESYISRKQELSIVSEGGYLLVDLKGNKLYAKYVYRVVRKHISSVSSNERKSPHVLRHTFATHLTNNGADMNSVKELLGHSSLASTQVYTSNSIEKLKDVYNLSHPKSQLE